MLVGVGARRALRDMFEQAKKQSPCIISLTKLMRWVATVAQGWVAVTMNANKTLNQCWLN